MMSSRAATWRSNESRARAGSNSDSAFSRRCDSPTTDLVEVGDHLLRRVENSIVESDRDIVVGRRESVCEELLLGPLANDVTGHEFTVPERANVLPEAS